MVNLQLKLRLCCAGAGIAFFLALWRFQDAVYLNGFINLVIAVALFFSVGWDRRNDG